MQIASYKLHTRSVLLELPSSRCQLSSSLIYHIYHHAGNPHATLELPHCRYQLSSSSIYHHESSCYTRATTQSQTLLVKLKLDLLSPCQSSSYTRATTLPALILILTSSSSSSSRLQHRNKVKWELVELIHTAGHRRSSHSSVVSGHRHRRHRSSSSRRVAAVVAAVVVVVVEQQQQQQQQEIVSARFGNSFCMSTERPFKEADAVYKVSCTSVSVSVLSTSLITNLKLWQGQGTRYLPGKCTSI